MGGGRASPPLETETLETLGVKPCMGEGKTASKTIIWAGVVLSLIDLSSSNLGD